jgi:hypothetical protein
MKLYRILSTFNGSQAGAHVETFTAGTEAELSESLAEVAVSEGWAEDAATPAKPATKKGK